MDSCWKLSILPLSGHGFVGAAPKDGKTRRREDGKTGRREDGKMGKREDEKTEDRMNAPDS
jgi:hypothetical protein